MEWTRCEERLPSLDVEVLVFHADDKPQFVMAAYREGPNGPYWDYVDEALSDVCEIMEPEPTHWTSKPQPPRDYARPTMEE
jgi:hypothetical protein